MYEKKFYFLFKFIFLRENGGSEKIEARLSRAETMKKLTKWVTTNIDIFWIESYKLLCTVYIVGKMHTPF